MIAVNLLTAISAYLADTIFTRDSCCFLRRSSMRFTIFLACAGMTLLASGCAVHRVNIATAPAPVVVSDTARETLPNDYLRVSFLPAGVQATTLSRPGALRAFT